MAATCHFFEWLVKLWEKLQNEAYFAELDMPPHARTPPSVFCLSVFSVFTYCLGCEKETREVWGMVHADMPGKFLLWST